MSAQDENRMKQLLRQSLPPVDPRPSRPAICGPRFFAASTPTRPRLLPPLARTGLTGLFSPP